MSRKRRLALIGAISAVVAVGALALGINSLNPTETPPAERETTFLNADEIVQEVSVASSSFEELAFPSEEVHEEHLRRISSIPFESDGHWEEGIEKTIVLDSWRCSWLDNAVHAGKSGDLEEVKRSGQALMSMLEIPEIVHNFRGLEGYMESVVHPLLEGNAKSVSGRVDRECASWREL